MPSGPLPSPRAHLAASLRLLDALAAGGEDRWPGLAVVRRWLARPRSLPASAPGGLKLDGYRTASGGSAWGMTCNDRWEGRPFWRVVEGLAKELDGDWAVEPLRRVRGELSGASVTLGIGFDAPGHGPRLKIYFQEPSWRQGVASVAQVRELVAGVPDSLPGDEAVGVVAASLDGAGGLAWKLYLGGEGSTLAERAATWLPERADELAMLSRCLEQTGNSPFTYLTLRLGAGAPRVALNPIYEVTPQWERPTRREQVWGEVRALLELAGRDAAWSELEDLQALLSDVLLLPTATAIEAGGRSADVYVAAFPR